MSKALAYEFPLRADFSVQLVVPVDLTPVEVRRLASFLETLVIPQTIDVAYLQRVEHAAQAYAEAYDKATYEGYDATPEHEALWAILSGDEVTDGTTDDQP